MSVAEDAGWLDTNIFVHARTRDDRSAACRRLLGRLASGESMGRIDPVVVHELTYALPHVFPMGKLEVADYIKTVLTWESIDAVGGKEPLIVALTPWAEHGISFVDALLAARALQDGTMVSTENVKDIIKVGALATRPG